MCPDCGVLPISQEGHIGAIISRIICSMQALAFLWGVLGVAYAPGALLLHVLKRSLTPLEHLSLSLSLGLIVSAVVYWLFAIAGRPVLFVACPVAAVGLLLYLRRRDLTSIRLKLEPSLLALLAVLALGVMVLVRVPLFFDNL